VSDYNPTTQDIKIYHALGMTNLDLATKAVANDSFDHWFTQHNAEVVEATEKRIIALLNLEHLGPSVNYPLSFSERQVLEILIENLITLIKGESK
jgi:hypothetical protein